MTSNQKRYLWILDITSILKNWLVAVSSSPSSRKWRPTGIIYCTKPLLGLFSCNDNYESNHTSSARPNPVGRSLENFPRCCDYYKKTWHSIFMDRLSVHYSRWPRGLESAVVTNAFHLLRSILDNRGGSCTWWATRLFCQNWRKAYSHPTSSSTRGYPDFNQSVHSLGAARAWLASIALGP
jgi:hypothetical protein